MVSAAVVGVYRDGSFFAITPVTPPLSFSSVINCAYTLFLLLFLFCTARRPLSAASALLAAARLFSFSRLSLLNAHARLPRCAHFLLPYRRRTQDQTLARYLRAPLLDFLGAVVLARAAASPLYFPAAALSSYASLRTSHSTSSACILLAKKQLSGRRRLRADGSPETLAASKNSCYQRFAANSHQRGMYVSNMAAKRWLIISSKKAAWARAGRAGFAG